MVRREASIDDVVVEESERRTFGPRSDADPDPEIPLR